MSKIKSRNPLFAGVLIDKPPLANLVRVDPEEGELYACPHCGEPSFSRDCGTFGAEPDCLFCGQCNREFRVC